MDKVKIIEDNLQGKNITRKQAMKKLTALTAASLLFLETKAQAQDSSGGPAKPPDRGRGGQ